MLDRAAIGAIRIGELNNRTAQRLAQCIMGDLTALAQSHDAAVREPLEAQIAAIHDDAISFYRDDEPPYWSCAVCGVAWTDDEKEEHLDTCAIGDAASVAKAHDAAVREQGRQEGIAEAWIFAEEYSPRGGYGEEDTERRL